MKSSPHDVLAYFRAMFGHARGRFVGITLAMVAASLSAGIGLLMLIPLLGMLGVQASGVSVWPVYQAILDLFAVLHIPFNLLVILLIFVALISLQAGFHYWQELASMRLARGFADEMRDHIYRALLQCEWKNYTKLRSADVMHVLTDDIDRLSYGTHFLLSLMAQLIMAAVYLAVAWNISSPVTMISLVGGLGLGIMMRGRNRQAESLGDSLSESSQDYFRELDDNLGGMKIIKSHALELEQLQRLRNITTALREQELNFLRSNNAMEMTFRIASAVLLAGFVYIAVNRFGMAIADMLVIILIFSRLLPLIGSMQQGYAQFLYTLPAYTHAQTLLNTLADGDDNRSGVTDSTELSLNESIEFQGVGFTYERLLQRHTLADITLSIRARQTTAIIGPSGAGKSTLVDLLTGLLMADHGQLKIDQQLLDESTRNWWRRQIAYVPQEVYLFPATIRANLQFGNNHVSEERIWLCLEMAAAADFVRELPEQLDSKIGERGIKLSGGERQRIALARALLRDPQLLILDEATSALDRDNERRIHQAIERLHGQITIVVIAHRLATVQHADHIVVLREGRITEQGDWPTLLANPAGYLGSHRLEIEEDAEVLL